MCLRPERSGEPRWSAADRAVATGHPSSKSRSVSAPRIVQIGGPGAWARRVISALPTQPSAPDCAERGMEGTYEYLFGFAIQEPGKSRKDSEGIYLDTTNGTGIYAYIPKSTPTDRHLYSIHGVSGLGKIQHHPKTRNRHSKGEGLVLILLDPDLRASNRAFDSTSQKTDILHSWKTQICILKRYLGRILRDLT